MIERRRQFLIGLGSVFLFGIPGLARANDTTAPSKSTFEPYSDPFFESSMRSRSSASLTDSLVSKKVMIAGEIDLSTLITASEGDDMVEFRGRLYPETELELYALAIRMTWLSEITPRLISRPV
jgi:hypothetical protein